MASKKLPAGYTTCEEYKGAIIAVKNGLYKGFSKNGNVGPYGTRGEVRKVLDI